MPIIGSSASPKGVPGAPTIGTATAGDGSASVTFSAPSFSKLPITSYTVTASPGGATGTGGSSPITVSGLTNGTAYTFTVRASHANGQSAASSASNSVSPLAPYVLSQTFNSSGTYTVPAGKTQVAVMMVGSGRGTFGSGEGGSGSRALAVYDIPTNAGTNYTVTVGAGAITGTNPSNFGNIASVSQSVSNYNAGVGNVANGGGGGSGGGNGNAGGIITSPAPGLGNIQAGGGGGGGGNGGYAPCGDNDSFGSGGAGGSGGAAGGGTGGAGGNAAFQGGGGSYNSGGNGSAGNPNTGGGAGGAGAGGLVPCAGGGNQGNGAAGGSGKVIVYIR
jgi:hypothetical protein